MTNIIAFRASPRTGVSRSDRPGPAEILFFTGVRYVRDEEDQPAPPAAPVRKPRAASADVPRDERLLA